MELLPCPFCGGKAKLTSAGRGQYKAGVQCADSHCGCRLWVAFRSKADAVAAWNTRSITASAVYGYEAAQERIDQLEQLCIDMYGCATGCTYPQNQRDNFEAKYHDRMADLGLLEGE